MKSEAESLESEILRDIASRSGRVWRKIGGISTKDKEDAQVVLPILEDWLGRIQHPSIRHALYSCFLTPHAAPYIDKLIGWWQNETSLLAVNSLTQILATIAKPKDADRLWNICREKPGIQARYLLLAKLATFPTTAAKVKDQLVLDLNTTSLTAGDLEDISKVDDPRIRQWFAKQVFASNPYIRKIAKRVVARCNKLPSGIQYVPPPDRGIEVFSTETDVENVKPILVKLSERFRFRIPDALRSLNFLSSLELDRWTRTSTMSEDNQPMAILLRLEDIDTVEVVLTHDSIHSIGH